MIPATFPEQNIVIGYGQAEYESLPAHISKDHEGRVTFCMRLTEAEIEEIVRTKTIWLQQLTLRGPFQPIALSTQKPELKMTPQHNAYTQPRKVKPGCEHRLGCACDAPYWLRQSTPAEQAFEKAIQPRFECKDASA